METKELEELGRSFYLSAVYMLDYDLMGLNFDKQSNGKRLFAYLVSIEDNILKQLSDNEFKVVLEAFKNKLKDLYKRQDIEEQKEIAKLIKWVNEDFTYESICRYKGV